MQNLKDQFAQRGLLAKYYNELGMQVCNIIDWSIARLGELLKKKQEEDRSLLAGFEEDLRRFFANEFAGAPRMHLAKKGRALAFGSYNLMLVAKKLAQVGGKEPWPEHYGFSGLISALSVYSHNLNKHEVRHLNPFRRGHIIKDFNKHFTHRNKGEFAGLDMLLLDFLEERFDIGLYENTYFTKSDAFEEAFKDAPFPHQVMPRTDEIAQQLWQEKCLEFIELVREFFAHKPIVLVKMKLAQYYGISGKEYLFADIDNIRVQNAIIEGCYQFFIDNCPEAIVLELESSDWYFTDISFRHGCHPWHLNEGMTEIAKMAQAAVEDKFMTAIDR
jgi:hypothetical protein